jgi:hypothetical protein
MRREKTNGRGSNPHSLANLRPIQPGEIRNPTGKNRMRPYTEAIERVSMEPLPELVRAALNAQFRKEVRRVLKRAREIPDFYQRGVSWAEASAVRLNWNAVFHGNIAAAVEVREAVEGRATTRIDFMSQNDKLEQLLEQFRRVAELAKAEEMEKKPVVTN